MFFKIISSFVTIFITTFLSLLLYEDVITYEANKIRKNLGKSINEKFKLMKDYQLKLKKGFMVIKTIIKLISLKNKNVEKSDLQIFLKDNKKLTFISEIRKNDSNCHINNNNLIFKNIYKFNLNEEENNINSNIVSNVNESNIKSLRENNILELSTCRNLILNKVQKYKRKNKFERSNIQDFLNHHYFTIQKQYKIIQTINYQYLTPIKKLYRTTKIRKYFYVANRNFTFPGKFSKITCTQVYITQNQNIKKVSKNLKRVNFKIFIIFMIYIVIIFLLMNLIQNVLVKYGKNFLVICILPFVSSLIIEYLISFNLMMLITSLILYNYGQYFVINKKLPFPLFYISKIFINPIVMNHYNAIKLFQQLK